MMIKVEKRNLLEYLFIVSMIPIILQLTSCDSSLLQPSSTSTPTAAGATGGAYALPIQLTVNSNYNGSIESGLNGSPSIATYYVNISAHGIYKLILTDVVSSEVSTEQLVYNLYSSADSSHPISGDVYPNWTNPDVTLDPGTYNVFFINLGPDRTYTINFSLKELLSPAPSPIITATPAASDEPSPAPSVAPSPSPTPSMAPSPSPTSISTEVTTLAGDTPTGFVDAVGADARFYAPNGIVAVSQYLYVADTYNNRIRRIDIISGEVTTFAGGAYGFYDATGTFAEFAHPASLATDGTNLFVADTENHRIRQIVISSGAVTTIAGGGSAGYVNGTGLGAKFFYPQGIATDGTSVFVTEVGGELGIRQIDIATRAVSTLAGNITASTIDGRGTSASFNAAEGLAVSGGDLFVTEIGGNFAIRRVNIQSRDVTTIAGGSGSGFLDATGTAAMFYYPNAVSSDGSLLYIADKSNCRIRKVDLNSMSVTTFAGTGNAGSDNGTKLASTFNYPKGLVAYGTKVYVTTDANEIRVIEK